MGLFSIGRIQLHNSWPYDGYKFRSLSDEMCLLVYNMCQIIVKGNLIPDSGNGIDVGQLASGQANATIPVFNGFKI